MAFAEAIRGLPFAEARSALLEALPQNQCSFPSVVGAMLRGMEPAVLVRLVKTAHRLSLESYPAFTAAAA